MHLEALIKTDLIQYRKDLDESNDKLSLPNYENLHNTKKLSLRKLIGNIELKGENSLIIIFNSKKLKKLTLKQELRINTETVRNAIFLLIPGPQKI